MKFAISSICSAFSEFTIGSKVVDHAVFLAALENAVEQHDLLSDRVAGQHFIVLPPAIFPSVSAGDGAKTMEPNDYVVRIHRGEPQMFLRRERVGQVNFLACVVYTRAAYMADPEVLEDEAEEARIGDASHVIVAVIASSGPRAPLTPERFVKNLAGKNKEALIWSAEETRDKAREIAAYWGEYAVVAD
jgi:hypothetical protein